MVTLRHFNLEDAESVRSNLYPDMKTEDIADMIDEWNTFVYQGRRFEMFAVLSDNKIAGYASLYELNQNIASTGIEIYGAERGKGFASEAMLLLLAYASERKYRIILDQVRTDNPVSIKLHNKLGFESDEYVYRNQRDHEIFIYIKIL